MIAPLNKGEAAQLKKLLQDDSWPVLEKCAALFIAAVKEEEIAGTSAYEELKMMHLNAGRAKGLAEFLTMLDQQAYK